MFLKYFTNPSWAYVAATIAVSAISFLRNIFFMKNMSHEDLGQIAMVQTIVVVVGFLQFGLINGGYRLYAGSDIATECRINNSIVTCFSIIFCLLLPALWFLEYLGDLNVVNIKSETIILGYMIGFVTLGATWINNTLIAKGRLGISSAVNFCAAALSLSLVLIPESISLNLAFIVFLVQPVVILVFTLFLHPLSRPSLSVDKTLIIEIIKLGFAPFFAGMIMLINLQVERWFIISYLGADAMGIYYLNIVYATVFTLIPVSLLNLFYPRSVNAYEKGQTSIFLALIRKHLLILISYVLLVLLSTLLFLPLVISRYLASFKGYEYLVFFSLPGLVAYVLFDNAALILQSAKKMRNILFFALLALSFNLISLTWAVAENLLTLGLIAALKSVSFVTAAGIIALNMYLNRKTLLLSRV